ncbi:MAG: Crp/Fnr family transcriptional regulator [Bacteroidetes bacterium]|nr:Crp/Fnr family transcriptional regulator [Bacteroidota bacterium]
MEKQQKKTFLASIPVFANLGQAEIELLAAIAHNRRAPKFQFVYMPDEPADYMFVLIKGRIKTGTFSHDGREVIKEILHPGAVFGDLALAGEEKRSDYAQVLYDEAEFLAIKVGDFQKLMSTNQRVLFSCLQHIMCRLQRVEERLAKLVLKDARERIIEFLVETASKEGRRVGFETLVKHHLTQQDIANITGTSRQTVTSVFNDLKKSNLIHFNRNSILIRDLERLS